jgi:hypothetical protein
MSIFLPTGGAWNTYVLANPALTDEQARLKTTDFCKMHRTPYTGISLHISATDDATTEVERVPDRQ